MKWEKNRASKYSLSPPPPKHSHFSNVRKSSNGTCEPKSALCGNGNASDVSLTVANKPYKDRKYFYLHALFQTAWVATLTKTIWNGNILATQTPFHKRFESVCDDLRLLIWKATTSALQ